MALFLYQEFDVIISISIMKKLKTSNDREQGFTLVELLISIAVISMATLGVASLFYTIQYTQRQSMYFDTANRSAQRQIEVLRNSSYNNLEDGEIIDFTSDLPDILPGDKSGTVVVSEPTAGLKRVDVNVTFYDHGRKREVQTSSLIGVIGIAQ